MVEQECFQEEGSRVFMQETVSMSYEFSKVTESVMDSPDSEQSPSHSVAS